MLACLATGATAQNVVLLDEIVASASLVPVVAGETGATVDALEEDDIEIGDARIATQIDRLPGTTFATSGGIGQEGKIRVRGLDSYYVVTRLDGIDISDPSNPQNYADFGGFTKSGIARVELLKGTQSALYGSQAIAGVIDMQSFRAEGPGTSWRADLEFGSFGTVMAGIGLGHRSDRAGLAFSLSHTRSDGISAAASGTERDGFDETMATLNADFAATDTVTLGFSAFVTDARVEYDNGFPIEDADNVNENLRRGARVFAIIDSGAIEHELSLSAYAATREYPGGFVPLFKGERITFGYSGTLEQSWGTAVFGAEQVREKADIGSIREDDRNAVYGEVLLERGALDLSLAARYEHSDDFGGNVSGRIAAAYDVTPTLTLKTALATGFRAPSLDERFASYGNPDLTVEKSRSVELGVVKEFAGGAALEATAFYTEIDDRIGFGAMTYEQVDGRAYTRGVELAAEVPLGESAGLYGSYTYTDAEVGGSRLPRVPLHDLVLGVEAAVAPRLTVSGDLTHVAGKPGLDDYTLLGAGLSYEVSDTTTAYLRVDNLADEDYQTSPGYNMPGRTWTVGLSAEF